MGVYNTVLIPCPNCGEKYEAQSKSGLCILDTYELKECPSDVLEDVNRHAPFFCECGDGEFEVKLELYGYVRPLPPSK